MDTLATAGEWWGGGGGGGGLTGGITPLPSPPGPPPPPTHPRPPGEGGIPADEMALAADLYEALQTFFLGRERLVARPLVIAGESYAG